MRKLPPAAARATVGVAIHAAVDEPTRVAIQHAADPATYYAIENAIFSTHTIFLPLDPVASATRNAVADATSHYLR